MIGVVIPAHNEQVSDVVRLNSIRAAANCSDPVGRGMSRPLSCWTTAGDSTGASVAPPAWR
jgi:hypothetical protein